jgi:hypothetical protein
VRALSTTKLISYILSLIGLLFPLLHACLLLLLSQLAAIASLLALYPSTCPESFGFRMVLLSSAVSPLASFVVDHPASKL